MDFISFFLISDECNRQLSFDMTLYNAAAAEFKIAVFGGGDVGEGIVGTRERVTEEFGVEFGQRGELVA